MAPVPSTLVRKHLQDLRDPAVSKGEPPVGETRLSDYAGAMIIIAGVVALLQSFLFLVFAEAFGTLSTTVCWLGIPSGIFGLICLEGGWRAIKRDSVVLAMLGAVCAIASIGFGVGVILGIISLRFLSVSKDEFEG